MLEVVNPELLYTELTSLAMKDETVTEYVIRAEKAAFSLKSAGEQISDSLLIAMVLKGLPDRFKPFIVVITQGAGDQTFSSFKEQLRSFEETEAARKSYQLEDSVMTMNLGGRHHSTGKTTYTQHQHQDNGARNDI